MIARLALIVVMSCVTFACISGARQTDAASLASACEPLPIDASWRSHQTWRAELTLPAVVLIQDSISHHAWIDDQPFEAPRGLYSISLFPVPHEHTVPDSGTVRCPRLAGDRTYVSVLRHAKYPGVWFIAGWWPSEKNMVLWGRSRDAWGARALATGIRSAVLLPPLTPERP